MIGLLLTVALIYAINECLIAREQEHNTMLINDLYERSDD